MGKGKGLDYASQTLESSLILLLMTQPGLWLGLNSVVSLVGLDSVRVGCKGLGLGCRVRD